MKTYSLLISCLFLLPMVISYEFRCPIEGHWKLRARAVCNNTDDYRCMWDINNEMYIEQCEGTEYQMKGFRRIFAGNTDRYPCSADKYQPFRYTTKGNYVCVFEKSNCSEIGQIVYDHGDTTHERTCRCDHTKAYDFVYQPKNKCYCEPAKEDCSCFIKPCPGFYVLDIDYDCQPRNNWKTAFRCREPPACSVETAPPEQLNILPLLDTKYPSLKRNINMAAALILLILLFGTYLFICIRDSITTITRKKKRKKLERKNDELANKLKEVSRIKFRCRFCGIVITDSRKCIQRIVNNAEVYATWLKNDIVFQEVSSLDDQNVIFTIITTKEADVTVQSNTNSLFRNYDCEVVTCKCTKSEEKDEPRMQIGWKYTRCRGNEKLLTVDDYFYGLRQDLLLDDTDHIMCKTKGCHSKVARGCDITNRRANEGTVVHSNEIEFANTESVLVQELTLPNKGTAAVLVFRGANVSTSREISSEMTAFQGFHAHEVQCYMCKKILGWMFKQTLGEPLYSRSQTFYVLFKDKLIDSSEFK